MASSYTNENMTQCKTCRCGKGDTNIWTTRTSDNPEKQVHKCPNCKVIKSGLLFISSKGIGWTSWKKRWFILTRTSMVFYRSDPNSIPQKGSEANLTLGGIDLNSSGSVVVKADKKLLTVLFPDGRDGRAFTLKAETSEDLYEWKTALENALGQAPSAVLATGQNGIFPNDIVDSIEASFEQWNDKRQVKSLVVGRPVLLALEDVDGTPSFLEKALRFIEEYGIKVEGILRQSADVEEVEHRVHDYEQGKNEFYLDEDAHVVADCIKHVLRELPSSPVPASCCTALVEAYRTDRGSRINAMRAAIAERFPEPNRRLVQRILKMMRTVASHKSENRMTLSALAACMAPLLLRPLLAGDCELEDDFNMGGDGSIQLLQAAAAANHAQAIVIILLEEYENIFDEDLLQEGYLFSDLYSGSEDDDVDDEEMTDDGFLEDDGYHDADNGLEVDVDDDPESSSSGVLSESNSDAVSDLFDNEVSEDHTRNSSSLIDNEIAEMTKTLSNTTQTPILQHISNEIPLPQHTGVQKDGISRSKNDNFCDELSHESHESINDVHTSGNPMLKSVTQILPSSNAICMDKSEKALSSIKKPTVWGRTSARKNLSMESIDYSSDDEIAIQRLEMTKSDLQTKITKELKRNVNLQASMERRKEALHERRLALGQDVERLREQLQKERDLRASLEAGLMNLRPGHLPNTTSMDKKTRSDLEEITLAEADIINLKQKAAELRGQLSHQLPHSYASLCESCGHHLYPMHQSAEKEQQKDISSTILVQREENSSKTEDILPRVALDNVQARKQDLHSLSNKEHLPKQQLDRANHQYSTVSPGSSSASCAEEPTTAVHDAAASKKSSKDEKSMHLGFETNGNVKAEAQDSTSSPDKQSPKKLPIKARSRRGSKSVGPNSVSSAEDPTTCGRTTGVKRYSFWGDTTKKETQDPQSLPNKQPSRKQQPSTKGEETASSSSSALTKLTNRLNFLKERRVQLVNELQNMDTVRRSSPEAPPSRTNSI